MALNSSGPISLAGTTTGVSIEIENGGNGTTTISLNDTAVRTLAGVTTPGSTIIMPTNFYGKSNAFTFTITSNQSNANLRSLAVTAGWNQSSALQATINSTIVCSASSTGNYGLTINGSFPGGVTLTNNGYILGMGGSGGWGGSPQYGYCPKTQGSSGGTGLLISSAVTINNASGVIGGGGGGAGGGSIGQFNCNCPINVGGGGGGGGRTGSTNSSGGPVGPYGAMGSGGNAGTQSSGGGGGAGKYCGPAHGGGGGTGGTWGASGGCGGAGYPNAPEWLGGGGGGGNATSGASNVTWTNVGTRYGTVG